MALTVEQGFDKFFANLVPLASQREAAYRHRKSVESSLSPLGVSLFRETGSSFNHGTGVRGHCDVDLLVSLKSVRPGSSDTALERLKTRLSISFPYTRVRVSRPAVVVEFASGSESWELIPAFLNKKSPEGHPVYWIPGSPSGWIESAPTAHLAYVNEVNAQAKISGGAKRLARLAKAWKYFNAVPISSFYLEMRAAKYLSAEPNFIPVWDICRFLEHLDDIQLSSMNDPKGLAGRFSACSSDAKAQEARSKVTTASVRARKALDAYQKSDVNSAFYYLDLLFGNRFPSR